MFDKTIEAMQARRLSAFLEYYFPRHRDWYQNTDADRFRIYKRDDDLADELMALAQFGPVAESFYLRAPQEIRLRSVLDAVESGLNNELSGLFVAALRLAAKRIVVDPGRIPLRRRIAVIAAMLHSRISER